MTALLELRDVSKTYSSGLLSAKSTVALKGVSLTLDEAEPTILTVAGESGSGKTTLAMLLLGFTEPTTDQIIIEARDFLRAIETGELVWPTFRDGLEVTRIVAAAMASSRSGAWTRVDSI